MARMLANHPRNHMDFGCCAMCARKKSKPLKPGPRERHLARQREKRQWRKEEVA